MAWFPQRPSPALMLVVLVLFGACRSPTPNEEGKAENQLYGTLDPIARELAEEALQSTLESLASDSSRHWQVDGTAVSGSVTPLRTFRIKTGHYCREFRESVAQNGVVVARVETACRNATGGWIVVIPQDRRG